MSSEQSWSMRGVDQRARKRALDQARQDGVTVGEWINRKILNDDEGASGAGEDLTAAVEQLSRRIEATEHRATLTITGIDQSVLGLVSRLQSVEGAHAELEAKHVQAISDLMNARDALAARIVKMEGDDSNTRNLAALKSLEASLARLAAQLSASADETVSRLARAQDDIAELQGQFSEAGEGVTAQLAVMDEELSGLKGALGEVSGGLSETDARVRSFDAQVGQLDVRVSALREQTAGAKDDIARINETLQSAGEASEMAADELSARLEAGDDRIAAVEDKIGANTERQSTLNKSVKTYAERLANAEAATNTAITALKTSFASLQSRVASAEAELASGAGLREEFGGQLQSLSDTLTALVDDTRANLAERLRSVASETRVDAIESRLASVSEDIEAAERRRSATLDTIVGEVAKLAASVDVRVREAEAAAEAAGAQSQEALDAAMARSEAAAERSETAASVSDSAASRSEAAAERSNAAAGLAGDSAGRADAASALAKAASDTASAAADTTTAAAIEAGQARDAGLDAAKHAASMAADAVDARKTALGAAEDASQAAERAESAAVDSRSSADVSTSAAGRAEAAEAAARETAEQAERLAQAHRQRLEQIAQVAGGSGSTVRAELEARLKTVEQSTAEALTAVDERIGDLDDQVRRDLDDTRAQSADVAARLKNQMDDLAGRFGGFADQVMSGDALTSSDRESLEQRIRGSEERTRDMVEEAMARLQDRFSDPVPRGETPSPVRDALEELSDRVDPNADPLTDDHNHLLDDEPYDEEIAETGYEPDRGIDDPLPPAPVVSADDVLAEAEERKGDPDTEYLKALDKSGSGLAGLGFGSRTRGTERIARDDRMPGEDPFDVDSQSFLDPEDAGSDQVAFDDDGAAADDDLGDLPPEIADAVRRSRDAQARGPETGEDDDVDVAPASTVRPGQEPGFGDSEENRVLGGKRMLAVASGMAFAAVGAAAYMVYSGQSDEASTDPSPSPSEPGPSAGAAPSGGATTTAAIPVDQDGLRADLTRTGTNLAAQYELGEERLASGELGRGVALIQSAADGGLAPAQYRLGQLYETGTGLNRNLVEARRWTERAANAGHREAMHDLGVKFANGRGAPQSYDNAVRWFEAAARLGATDSQYNLGVLYEQGLGVSADPVEAYAWYSIAARSGDSGASERASAVGGLLRPEEQAAADQKVAGFVVQPLDAAANGLFDLTGDDTALSGAALVQRAQVLLGQLGFDPGRADGNIGPGTRQAVVAFQRQESLPETGRVDAGLLQVLERRTGG